MPPPSEQLLSRRGVVRSLTSGLAAVFSTSMFGRVRPTQRLPDDELGRLRTRHAPATETLPPGLHSLGLRKARDGVLYLPSQYRSDVPIQLVVLLHGAGGSGAGATLRFRAYADEIGIAFVAPDSTDSTWDRSDRYQRDVRFIDQALATAYRRCNARSDRLGIAGFSDGASCSLGLGLTNGDLFGRILALSPGYCAPAELRGKPELYVTHGTRDEILPIDLCSRRIVPRLRTAGYGVDYHEFDGKHETPRDVCRPAFQWLSRA